MNEQERSEAAAEVRQDMKARLASIGEWPESLDGWNRAELVCILSQTMPKLDDLSLLAVLRIVNALAFPRLVGEPLEAQSLEKEEQCLDPVG